MLTRPIRNARFSNMSFLRFFGGAAMLGVPLSLSLLVGCQSTREAMLAEGYPEAFVEGFDAGCSSGLQAAGSLGVFRKDAVRYRDDAIYLSGWDDGFRQCLYMEQAKAESERVDRREVDEDWERDRDRSIRQSMGRAMAGRKDHD